MLRGCFDPPKTALRAPQKGKTCRRYCYAKKERGPTQCRNAAKELLDDSRLNAITQRMRSYQKAIHAETKPLRPGVPKKGTLESAAAEAKQLEERIYLKKQLETTKVEQSAAHLQSEGPPWD